MSTEQHKLERLATLRLVLVYIVFAGLWIFLSDTIVDMLIRDHDLYVKLSILKGLLFILITGALLYQLIRRYGRKIHQIEAQAITALKASEQSLAGAQRVAHIGSWERDSKAATLKWSEELYHIFGVDSRTFIPTQDAFMARVHPEDRARVRTAINTAPPDRKAQSLDFRILLPDGSVRTVRTESEIIAFDNEGKPEIIHGTTQDITEQDQARKKMEEMNHFLERRAKELASANEELATFSYSLAHNMRNSIYAITLNIDVLSKELGPELGAGAREAMGYITHHAQSMTDVMHNLMALSGVSRHLLKYETVNLSDLAQSICRDLAALNPGQNVKLEIQPALTAHGDPGLLRILLENLFNNAWKFTALSPAPRIEFGKQDDKARLCFFVRDNGVGFDSHKAGRLFVPFERFHSEKDFQGSGIGLSMVKRIVEKHGGLVWAESEVGKGATFYFCLPF